MFVHANYVLKFFCLVLSCMYMYIRTCVYPVPHNTTQHSRLTTLSRLKLPVQPCFSLALIFDQLSPQILADIAQIAGYSRQKDHLSAITDFVHAHVHYGTPGTPLHSLPYQQLCESLLKVAASKALQGILFNESVIKLLKCRPPPSLPPSSGGGDEGEGSEDGSSEERDRRRLAVAVREVLKCLVEKSVMPSPLKPALRLMELERVYGIVSFECLGSVAECEYIHVHVHTCTYLRMYIHVQYTHIIRTCMYSLKGQCWGQGKWPY